MHIRAITRVDLPAVNDIAQVAFMDAELDNWLYPHRHELPNTWRSHISRRSRGLLVSPDIHGLVCVTDEEDPSHWPRNKVVGYSWWVRKGPADNLPDGKRSQTPNGFTNAVERILLQLESRYIDLFQMNKCVSDERQAIFARESASLGDLYAPLRAYWYLIGLAVHPDWQGRGVGRKLMQWGFDRSSEEEIPITLIASVPGQPFYKALGFKIVNWAWTESVTPWAEGGAIMIRDPGMKYTREAVGDETKKQFWGRSRDIEVVYT